MNSQDFSNQPDDSKGSLSTQEKCSLVFERLEKAIAESAGGQEEELSRRLATMEKIYHFAFATSRNKRPFCMFDVMKDRREDLTQLGAVGYVEMVTELEPLYDQWMDLHQKTEYLNAWGKFCVQAEETEESRGFLKEHREEIRSAYRKMESFDDMNLLLIKAGNRALQEVGFEGVK